MGVKEVLKASLWNSKYLYFLVFLLLLLLQRKLPKKKEKITENLDSMFTLQAMTMVYKPITDTETTMPMSHIIVQPYINVLTDTNLENCTFLVQSFTDPIVVVAKDIMEDQGRDL
uniref:Shell gland specific gene I n=1 Tax=Artemia parthenogenetica TaxID=6663 RepID=B3GE05_ARTPA|nr:shell gland specific gene I [Artemia parthenogenetica]